MFSINSLMVVGVNTRPIVKSAKALGLKTIAVDCFGDVDLAAYADTLFSVRPLEARGSPKEFKRPNLFELSLRALEIHDVDAIFLTSGMEHNPTFIQELGKKAEIIGNNPIHLKLCRDKEKLFRIANRLGIPCPQTKKVRRLSDALNAAEEIGYPAVLKPAFGGGGIAIRLARSPEELERFFGRVLRAGDGRTVYMQQYVRGIDASASVLSNGNEARCLTVNEQIVGDKRLGSPRPFGYCGNMIPLDAGRELVVKIAEHSEALCREIGLVGSNGVDFVLSKDPYLMEINPRFQNTIDCVEGLLGINLVEEHIRSCRGKLGKYSQPKGHSVKLILYAKEHVKIPDLKRFPSIVDIPRKGSIVRKGRPLCSVLKFGKSRRRITAEAYSTANKVYRFCQR
ncbi:MAG: hypothetical protein AVW06_02140 [Hadesarchaea archaeon DG-33-1]|nr:MAG: hypothetical protein AVW06_02140 [Hadesarchaea archaeon DG-33-1]